MVFNENLRKLLYDDELILGKGESFDISLCKLCKNLRGNVLHNLNTLHGECMTLISSINRRRNFKDNYRKKWLDS